MKKFSAKVIVRMKPTVKDIKGLTLKRAVECFMNVENLNCHVGSVYFLEFDAKSETEALHTVEKIAGELLSNDVIETYEIKALDEV